MSDKKQKIRRPDEMPGFVNQVPHSTHSLNHGYMLTMACGHLNPVFYDYVNAGESLDCSVPFELITEPLISFAQAHITVHTEYFFVPMELIYQPFGDWYYGIRSQYSSHFADVERRLPLLNLKDVSDFVEARLPTTVDLVPECLGRRYVRLFDQLDLPTNAIFDQFDPETDPKGYYSTFPYGICAYNCIYEYFYRLDNRELFKNRIFNLDRYYNNGIVSFTDAEMLDFCTIKYRPMRDDYFTDVKVSPIVDVLNLNVKTELAAADSWLSRSSFASNNFKVLSAGSVGDSSPKTGAPNSLNNPENNFITNFGFQVTTNTPNNTNLSYNGLDINTANIRAMFASEKLWSITGRARKHYDDQTLAHFGFKVPHDPKHCISRFGHDVTPLDIGMVIATGASADTPLGEIAGKGRANGSATHRRFTAPCHGVVMIIMSIEPDMYYTEYRAKYTVIRDRSDLYTPEYDHLGLQPLFGYEVGYGELGNQDLMTPGWQFRYEQWKRRFNKVSNAFGEYGSRKSWIVCRKPFPTSLAGIMPNTATYEGFVYYPTNTNGVFVPQYQNNWSAAIYEQKNSAHCYDHDPFNVHLHINVSKRSIMSDYSLPRLDA